jgi:hypothetical protein
MTTTFKELKLSKNLFKIIKIIFPTFLIFIPLSSHAMDNSTASITLSASVTPILEANISWPKKVRIASGETNFAPSPVISVNCSGGSSKCESSLEFNGDIYNPQIDLVVINAN